MQERGEREEKERERERDRERLKEVRLQGDLDEAHMEELQDEKMKLQR
jgi:hypothetical protein